MAMIFEEEYTVDKKGKKPPSFCWYTDLPCAHRIDKLPVIRIFTILVSQVFCYAAETIL